MYEYIKGSFVRINKDYVVIENSGIGYKIFTSGSTMANMPKINDIVLLYVEQIVRQDFIGLYGFLTMEELNMFNVLLGINGVGAKAALSLLSITDVNNLKYAILSEDEKTLTRAPGIGKKTAQRIILELKDKIKIEEIYTEGLEKCGDEIIKNNKINEVLEALLSLGYTQKEAEKAFNNINKEESIENLIKECLKYLMN